MPPDVPQFKPDRIAVLGPGLLGGSLLMALRERAPGAELRAWGRRESVMDEVRRLGLATHASTDLAEVVEGADLVVLCTPVGNMPALATSLAGMKMKSGCVITDVGSVKARLVVQLEDAFSGSPFQYVGSHPMAGSERAGLEAARSDLFERQVCLITPSLFTTDHAIQTAQALWQCVGCRLLQLSPEEHDRHVARISHLPHVAAAAVTLAALGGDTGAAACAGNGFRDTTRVASGDAELWTGILLENLPEVQAAVRELYHRVGDLLAILENVDESRLRRFLHEAKVLRDAVKSSV